MKHARFSPEILPAFDNHRIISKIFDPMTGLDAYVVIHRGIANRPSFGATRIFPYATDHDALSDALKLSQTMSYKAALAGLKHGGAKGVIAYNPRSKGLFRVLTAYASRINYLGGHFITGADVGVGPKALTVMAKNSPYIVGLHVDPVFYTILGVMHGIEIALKEVFSSTDYAKRTFAIQGLGKTGQALLNHLYPLAKTIYVSDIHDATIRAVKSKYPRITVVKPESILACPVDVLSPCALSGIINKQSLHKLRCRIIAGSANNQLENENAGVTLQHMGILYAPDYVINAGGLITVVDEYEHKNPDQKRLSKKVSTIAATLAMILNKSKRTGKSTNIIADTLAKNISDKLL